MTKTLIFATSNAFENVYCRGTRIFMGDGELCFQAGNGATDAAIHVGHYRR